MTTWTVKLEGVYPGTEDDFIISFTDICDEVGPLSLKRYIIQDISDKAKEKSHYIELPNVKEVSSDKSDTMPHDRTALILATLKKEKKQVGILLYLSDELTYEVRGVRPANFINECRTDDKMITALLTQLTSNPEMFEDVNLVLPETRY